MRLNTIYRQGDTVGWRKPERNAHLAWTSSLCRCRKHWRLRQTLNLFCHSEPTLMCRRGCCSLKVSRAVFLGIVRRPQHGRVLHCSRFLLLFSEALLAESGCKFRALATARTRCTLSAALRCRVRPEVARCLQPELYSKGGRL